MSLGEKLLWQALRKNQLGFAFKRQVPVGRYVLDFYCPKASLCVEVDGEQHKARALQDGMRDDYLALVNIETSRIPSDDIFEEGSFERWLEFIRKRCLERE
jgi:very-short-patch-repair endonuclease